MPEYFILVTLKDNLLSDYEFYDELWINNMEIKTFEEGIKLYRQISNINERESVIVFLLLIYRAC